jgi:cell division protein FtsN
VSGTLLTKCELHIMQMFKALIFLAFVVITIVGWLVQFINSQNHPPPPNRRRKENDPASGKVRNEIEQFLEEARRSRQGLPPKDQPADSGIELVEPPRRPPGEQKGREEVWREQTQGRRQPQQQQAAKPVQQQRKQPRKQAKQVAQQPKPAQPKQAQPKQVSTLKSSGPGGVARHVQEQMSDRIGKGVAAHLPHSIDSNVQSHLGKFTADSEDSLGSQGYQQTKIRKSRAAGELQQLLRSKQGIRSAILVNEILGRPLSLRRHS